MCVVGVLVVVVVVAVVVVVRPSNKLAFGRWFGGVCVVDIVCYN